MAIGKATYRSPPITTPATTSAPTMTRSFRLIFVSHFHLRQLAFHVAPPVCSGRGEAAMGPWGNRRRTRRQHAPERCSECGRQAEPLANFQITPNSQEPCFRSGFSPSPVIDALRARNSSAARRRAKRGRDGCQDRREVARLSDSPRSSRRAAPYSEIQCGSCSCRASAAGAPRVDSAGSSWAHTGASLL